MIFFIIFIIILKFGFRWINEEDYKKFLIERSSQLEFKIRQVQVSKSIIVQSIILNYPFSIVS